MTSISISTPMSTIPIPVPDPASVLVDRELARRKKLRKQQQKGRILTGCREIDEDVLLGGFERGSVVGVSAEDDEMGLLIGLQTVAHLLVTATLEMIRNNQNDHGGGKTTAFSVSDHPRVTIVTMLPVNVLVPKLRQVLVNQLAAGLSSVGGGGGLQNINALVKRCLGNISISMVFDVEGLREVLGEVGGTLSSSLSPHDTLEEQEQEQQQQQRHVQPGQQQEKKEEQKQERPLLHDGPTRKEDPVEAETEAFQNEPVVSIPIRSPAKPQPVKSRFKTEILDSEDEGEDEDGVEVEDPGNATDMSSELSSPPASLPDEFEEHEKLQDSTRAPKWDENIPETTSGGTINSNGNQTDSIEVQAGEGGDNTGQTQPSPDNKDSEPSTDTNAQPQPSPSAAENSKPPTNINVQPPPPPPPPPPDMVLITQMSALLNGLFTGRDKPAAHETMTLLSSQLRQLASPFDGRASPLIMILNSTTTTTSASSASVVMTTGENNPHNPDEEQRPTSREQHHQQQQATTDPTLRSIFQHHHNTKPSFGTVFARLLDLHLLCTRIPRRQGQRQRQTPAARGGMGRAMDRGEHPLSTARAGTGAGVGAGGISSPSHRFAWAVEVLFDERGVYEHDFEGMSGEERGPPLETQREVRRRCREQRWGAVEVEEGGGRIVDVVI